MRSKIVLTMLVAVVVSALAAEQAAACSCVAAPPKKMFRWSDGAIEAALISKEPAPSANADFHYEALSVYKGRRRIDEGDEIVIRSSRSGASCGLPGREGRKYGLFLYRHHGEWRANLCTVIEAWRMRNAGERYLEDRGGGGDRVAPLTPPGCAVKARERSA